MTSTQMDPPSPVPNPRPVWVALDMAMRHIESYSRSYDIASGAMFSQARSVGKRPRHKQKIRALATEIVQNCLVKKSCARQFGVYMLTRVETVDYIIEQASGVLVVSARKMFGEYALYAGGKVIALVCDDQLFVKPTTAGREFIGTVVEAPPYKGAKLSFLISSDRLEDGEWLSELVRRTADALPTPIQKAAKHRSTTKPRPRK